MAEVIVEVLGRGGQVAERVRSSGDEVRIGRAYDNDVILSDPYVSPHHLNLRFEEARGWLVEDLGSDNGTQRQQGTPLSGPTPVNAGTELWLGRTHVRISTPGQPVAPTRPLNPAIRRFARLGHPLLLILLVLGAWGSESLTAWLDTTRETELARLAANGLMVIIVMLAWTGLWSFVARLVSHRTHFPAQLGAAALVLLTANLLGMALEYVEFWSSNPMLHRVLLLLLSGLLLAGLIYANISLSVGPPRGVALVWSHGSAWLLVGVVLLFQIANQPDFQWQPEHSNMLKPPGWYWGEAPAPATLTEGMDEVFNGFATDPRD